MNATEIKFYCPRCDPVQSTFRRASVHSNTRYAPSSNMGNYIQSAKLNGQPLNRPWLTQEEIAAGGTLELEMGVLPNKAWGTGN